MLMLCPPKPNEFLSINLSSVDLLSFIGCLEVTRISISGSNGSALIVFGTVPSRRA